MHTVNLLDQLKEEGHRITTTRRKITKIFSDSDSPISAKDILELLGRSVNKTTVYRELDFLETKGMINVLPLSLGEKYYEQVQEHHHHLICEECGSIQRYDNCLVEKLEEDIQENSSFKVNNHSMEFYGLCKNCQK